MVLFPGGSLLTGNGHQLGVNNKHPGGSFPRWFFTHQIWSQRQLISFIKKLSVNFFFKKFLGYFCQLIFFQKLSLVFLLTNSLTGNGHENGVNNQHPGGSVWPQLLHCSFVDHVQVEGVQALLCACDGNNNLLLLN